MKISDYNLLEKIDETNAFVVYRGVRQGDLQTVIIKVLNTASASPADISAFQRDYDIITGIDSRGIINTHQIFSSPEGMVLVLEDFNGVSVRQVLNSEGPFDIAYFLTVAMKLAQTLGELHSHGIVHGQLRPHYILINKNTEDVKLSRFGVESLITHENDTLYNQDVSRKYLMYLSPEQTGRLNRVTDSRSDLYSLGVVFYEMLTGEPPFRSDNPFQLIHFHLSQKPVPPHEKRPDIPPVLSDIILTLLNKEADDRYQDGFSLKADVEHCQQGLKTQKRIDRFELGKTNRSNHLFIPQKLYGRATEYQLLLSAFERMVPYKRGGEDDTLETEIVLVKGGAGTGKTFLANEIRPLVLERKAYFTYGKFDPSHKGIPYSAIIQAFQYLIRQILTERDDIIEHWKKAFLEALNPNAKIMTALFPDLEHIIGPQPDVAELGLKEARNRFILTFERFVAVFARQEHPVVLLIDNMHWADKASLQLLAYLLSRRNIRHLFFIGSYREHEMSPEHAFTLAIKKVAESGIRTTTIELENLDTDAISALIQDFLPWDKRECRVLADRMYRKTGGNPFFIKELLHTWIDNDVMGMGHTPAWTLDAIERSEIPTGLRDMLADRIRAISDPGKEILHVCACMGSRFEPDRVAMFTGRSPKEIDGILSDLIRRRLIKKADGDHMFFHDLVCEAVYAQMNDLEKSEKHYALGEFLLGVDGERVSDTQLYQIADHLYLGRDCRKEPSEIERLCTLNLACARKAKNATAYAAASEYLARAMALLNEDSWDSQYDLTFSIHKECIEIASFLDERERMNQFMETALAKARTIQDKALVYRSKIAACSAQEDINEALSAAFFFNDLLGLKITGSRREMTLRYIKLKMAFWGKTDEDILTLPDMTDPLALAALEVGSNLGYFLYTMSPQIVSSGVLYNVTHSLTLGLSPQTAFNFCVLGLVLISRFGKINDGYRFGKLGMKMAEKPLCQQFKARAIYIYYSQISHWKEPLASTLDPFLEGYRIGIENGDPLYAADNLGMHDAHMLKCGRRFSEAEPIIRDHCNKIKQLNQEQIFYRNSITHQFVLNMLGESDDPLKLKGSAFDEDRERPKWIEQDKRLLLALYWHHVLTLCVVFNNTGRGLKASEEIGARIDTSGSSLTVRVYRFLDSLIRLKAHFDLPGGEQKKNLKQINENLALMKTWARHAPMNNLHMYQLIMAEKARVLKKYKLAETLYEAAITSCREQNVVFDEMLATECAAHHYMALGKKNLARSYLMDTVQCCMKLDAAAKLRQLRDVHPDAFALSDPKAFPKPMALSGSGNVDYSAIVKASQNISEEITLSGLLSRLTAHVMGNTPATQCCILLDHHGDLRVVAQADIKHPQGTLLSVNVNDYENVLKSMVKQAAGTQRILSLENATREGNYTLDPYVVEHQPKSILCYPMVGGNKLIGVIYVENDLSRDAFGGTGVEVLGMLASQFIISYGHARLLKDMAENQGP